MCGLTITLACAARRKRRGFLFTMPLMLGMGILIFSSMIAISQMFVIMGGPMIPDLLADMPTIFHYTANGTRVPQHLPLLADPDPGGAAVFHERFPALAMYGLMVKIALGIFVVLLMLAGLSYFFEEFNIVRQGTAYGLVAKMIVLVPIYLVLPYLWDMTALVIESSSLYLMDPFGGDPVGRTTEMWCKIGSVACSIDGTTTVDPLRMFGGLTGDFDRDAYLDQDAWNNSLQDPFFGEGFVINVLLALFKGFAVMFMTAMMFVLSAVRVMLTEVIIISFPLVTAVGLIPWINTARISDMFQQNLIGLSIAPVMSAIVLSVGLSTVDAQNMPPLRMWFQLLSVGFLAVFFPVMLSPMLGNMSTRVGNMVSTSITSASMAGSNALKGATSGVSQASGVMAGGAVAAGMGAGGGGGGGIPPSSGPAGAMPNPGLAGGGVDNRFSSAQMGAATSGASLGGAMSTMDRMRMYGKAATIGMLSGLGSGMLQSATRGIAGMEGAAGNIPNQMMHAGDARIGRMVHNASADVVARTAVNQMSEIERNLDVTGHSTPPRISRHTVMNPGDSMNAMVDNCESMDAGRQLASDPAARQEFARMCGQSAGVGEVPAEAQQSLDDKMARHIRSHPVAAGKMFGDLKAGRTFMRGGP